jgi:hypothetical protein
MPNKIIHIEEPTLIFGHEQRTIDPRDGLVLFGPNQPLKPYSLRVGVIGTPDSLKDYPLFVEELNKPIFSTQNKYIKLNL